MGVTADRRGQRIAAGALVALAVFALVEAGGERRLMADVAERETAGATSDTERAERLTAFVYRNGGFEKNHSYFVLPQLEATPLQIIRDGGDCADKSRLLAHLLSAANIRSSMALLKPCADCVPSHTIVIANLDGRARALDPVFDIAYPYDVRAMRAEPRLMDQYLDDLIRERGRNAKVAAYKRATEGYAHVTTINWQKNAATRAIGKAIGPDAWIVQRPLLLDDPRGFVATCLCLLAGLALGVVARKASN